MALEHVLASIEAHYAERAREVEEAAAERCAQIQAAATAEAAAVTAALEGQIDPETERLVRVTLAAGNNAATRTLRAAREQVFAQVLARLEARLESLDPEQRSRVDATLLTEARDALPGGEPLAADHLGTRWRAKDGRLLDNTVPARLQTALPELRRLVTLHLPALEVKR